MDKRNRIIQLVAILVFTFLGYVQLHSATGPLRGLPYFVIAIGLAYILFRNRTYNESPFEAASINKTAQIIVIGPKVKAISRWNHFKIVILTILLIVVLFGLGFGFGRTLFHIIH